MDLSVIKRYLFSYLLNTPGKIMRYISILLALSILIPVTIIAVNEDHGTRSTSFVESGATSFDVTSAPSFISVADWNNDGLDDILFNGNRLFRNNGPPDFDFTSMGSIFNGSIFGSSNGIWADWDGDGDQDLYQGCRKGTSDRFWENQGSPDFILEDISEAVFGDYSNTGPNMGNSWCDFDQDGDLDLYIGNGEDWNDGDPVYYPDYLLRNENGVSFSDISSAAGMRTGEEFYSRGATWGDFDNDRWQDLYVSHYRIRENHLFVNQHDGTFDEEGVERNCSGTYAPNWYEDTTAGNVYGQSMWGPTWGHTIGSAWADFNRDGNLDLWTSDFVHKYVGNNGGWYDIRGYVCDDGNLYINDGAPYYTFTDHRNTSGIPIWPIGGAGVYQGDQTFAGVSVGDIDNDGWEDMYIPQVYGDLPYTTPHLFRNKGYETDGSAPNGTTFEDITDQMGIKGANTYACLFFDSDNDGDMDIVTGGADTWDGSDWSNYRVRLYENQGEDRNSYLRVKLNGTGMNKDAIGARVSIRFEGPDGDKQIMTREVRAGTGQGHQQSNVLHFGLGTEIDPEMMGSFFIEVRWPDGNVQWVEVKEADKTIYVDKPSTGRFPVVYSTSVSPGNPKEDEQVYIKLDVQEGSEKINHYLWDLDLDNHFDRMTSSDSILFTPREGGTHQVRCYVSAGNDPGEMRYIAPVYPIEVDVINTMPEVSIDDFTGEMDSPIQPLAYSISDTQSDLRNLTWNLSWGDGSFDEGIGSTLPTHTYTSPGEFTMSLSVSDEEFTVDKEAAATIYNVPPSGWIEVIPQGKRNFTEDVWVEFHPHVSDTPSDDSEHEIVWIVDGKRKPGELGSSLFQKFHEPGSNLIQLEITDDYGGITTVNETVTIINLPPGLSLIEGKSSSLSGFEDEQLRFDMLSGWDNETDMQSGLNYSWDFGDGNQKFNDTNPITHHTYENEGDYIAVCSIKDKDGAMSTFSIDVSIENVPPEIIDSGLGKTYLEDELIELRSLDYTDTNSDRNSLKLEILTTGESMVNVAGWYPTLKFFQSGTYDITIKVTDDNGDIATRTESVEIINERPTGMIKPFLRSIDEDWYYMIESKDVSDTPSDLKNITIKWLIEGNKERITGENVTLHIEESGTWKITMIVSDGDLETFIEDTIRVINPTPTSILEIGNEKGSYKIGEYIIFDASKSIDNPSDMDSLEYFWDMDDGNTMNGQIVNYSFDSPGTYHVTLTVTDDDGDYHMSSVDIEVIENVGPSEDEDDPPWEITAILIIVVIALLMVAILVATLVSRTRKKQEDPPQPQMVDNVTPPTPVDTSPNAGGSSQRANRPQSQQGEMTSDRNL